MSKLGQEPAYPQTSEDLLSGALRLNQNPCGITKRFYSACMAMQGLLSNELNQAISFENIARDSFIMADELLKQELNE